MIKFNRDKHLTYSRLRQAVVYDPETGEFFWNESRRGVARGKKVGTRRRRGDIQLHIDRHAHLAHRVAWLYMTQKWPQEQIDHKDCSPENNRWNNLRIANNSLNQANRHISDATKSGFKGVSWIKEKQRWRAEVKKDGRKIHLGYFDSPVDAHEAYCDAALKLFGEFARPQ